MTLYLAVQGTMSYVLGADMVNVFDDESAIFVVLVNDEEQYSLWPQFKDIPAGWRQTGPVGNKADCLAFIESAWTDMRPLSLRRQRDAAGSSAA
ncbi:MbtH family protein [Bradyrhizobium sp. HKCCYLR20261]|uniref:MbtH family protein n=1 Tax=unclassified Bradyrhizobium TaxID=2631580 RepID=UPI003EBCE18F